MLLQIDMYSLRLLLVLATCCFLQVSWGKSLSDDDCENLSVIGGHNVFIQNAPYIAAIFENGNMTCTGTIIHESFILTAASCASKAQKRVLVGSARLHLGKRFYEVEKEICRPDYNRETYSNDVCLFKLRTKLRLGVKVRPIALPASITPVVDGTPMNVTGWGNVNIDGQKFPDRLQQTMVPKISTRCCARSYAFMSIYSMLCASSSGHGACERDQGAPLTYGNLLIGVFAGNPAGCGHVPAIYANVAYYVDWIKIVIELTP